MKFKKSPQTIYLAGPMTGIPQHNYPAFFRAEKRLKNKGYMVVNPARLNKGGELWEDCLRNDIFHIVKFCEGIALLHNWHKSKGACLELSLALRLGLKVIDAHTLRPLKITLQNIFTQTWKTKYENYQS